MRRLVLLAGLLALAAPAHAALPILPGPPTSLPATAGGPATAHQLAPTTAPRNPFMAAGSASNIHNDTWMTDAYPFAGPLGRNATSTSSAMAPAVCGSLTFTRAGQIVSVCPSALAAPQARVIDPKTLEILASYDLPNAPDPQGTKTYQNFT